MSQSNQKKKRPTPKRATGGSSAKKKAASQYTTQQKVLRGIYIALTVISAIIVLAYIGIHLFAAPPKPGPDGEIELTRPPQATTTIDPVTGEEIEIEIPGLPADRKTEFYTFLVVGQSQDSGGKLTDTMMLVAYDVPNQKLSVMNLPRDTWVRYNGQTIMINAVYNAAGGRNDDAKGIAGLKTAVRDLTGIYPDFHVIIQWEALGELVDAIGGVYFDVPFDMYYNDLSQHFKIDVKKGYQLLDGEGAMGVVRWRKNSIGDTGREDRSYGYAEGDLGRIKTQQAFMKAVIAKCIQPEVLLGNLKEYIDIFQKNVLTDLSVANMAYFGKAAIGGLDMDNVSFVTLPNKSAGDGAHLLPIGSQIVKEINGGFNPYEHDIRLGELRLADVSPLVTPTPDPEETEDPDATDDPDATPGPDDGENPASTASPRPSGGDDILLPPGTISRPTASPNSSATPRPSGSAAPSGNPSAGPGNSPAPTPSAAATESPQPVPSAEPPAETPAVPPVTPPPAEEPILPPGV